MDGGLAAAPDGRTRNRARLAAADQAGGGNVRQCGGALDEIPQQSAHAGVGVVDVAVAHGLHGKEDDTSAVITGIRCLDALDRADKQARTGQQDERQRHLHNDAGASAPSWPSPASSTAGIRPRENEDVEARGLQGGGEPEE